MTEFRASATFLVFLYSFLAFLTLGVLAVFALGLAGSPVGRAFWPLLLALALLARAWWVYLKIPFIITVQDDNTLEFKSFLRVVNLAPQDIVDIREKYLFPGFLQIKHTTGKLVLTTQMTDLPELIVFIKRENPAVQVSG
jgi:hypothetical protein